MKIEVEIPDWTEERTIYIMAGIELVAYREPGKKWKIKAGRCNLCGKCCMNLGKRHPFPVIDGRCIYLIRESKTTYECGLRISRPFGCCVGIPQNMPECTEIYKEL